MNHQAMCKHRRANRSAIMGAAFALILLTALTNSMAANKLSRVVQRQTLFSNGYFLFAIAGPRTVSVRFDPSGRGHYREYGANIQAYGGTTTGTVTTDGKTIRVEGAKYAAPGAGKGGNPGPFDHGEDLTPGSTLGQTFTVSPSSGYLSDVWAILTCSGVDNSAVTMTLRTEGPDGVVVARRRVSPLPNDASVHLKPDNPVPPGTYYLEIGEKQGGAYWWGCNTDAYPGGTAYIGGKAVPGKDWCFGYELAEVGEMNWSIVPAGSSLRCFMEGGGKAKALTLRFPWKKDGYDVKTPATTPFRYVTTDSGHYMPIEAFKRVEADWSKEPACSLARLYGDGLRDYDLKVIHARGSFTARMNENTFNIMLGSGCAIDLLPSGKPPRTDFPRFFASDAKLNTPLNRFLMNYLTSHTSCPSSFEWDTLKLAWCGGPIHDSLQRALLYFKYRIDPDGYIWSRSESRGWDGGDCSKDDTRHYDSNAPFIMACSRWYAWTGNRKFLTEAMEVVRPATNYLLDEMRGRTGVLTMANPRHTGVAKPEGASWPSSYWDCIPAGYRDAYINAFYAKALRASAQMERAVGNLERAKELDTLAAKATDAFNKTFWDAGKGRYISWIDSTGSRHDCGMTYVNTIAASYGLASVKQIKSMFRWMETEPTEAGKPDTFTRWVFAPRSNTQHCSEQANRMKYDEWCEDGGAILWTAYYEIMARARGLGADNAWNRFRKIIDRANEADGLIGGKPLIHGEKDNAFGEPGSVGYGGEFPESGIAPCAFLYAFLGVRADGEGLHIKPNLPKPLSFAGVENVVYHGRRLKITCRRDRVRVESSNGAWSQSIKPGTEALLRDLDGKFVLVTAEH